MQRRKRKEKESYPPFLPPNIGHSAGANAKFMGPGEQEGKKALQLACALEWKTPAPVTMYAACTEKS